GRTRLHGLLLDRLRKESPKDEAWHALVLAALEGQAALDSLLDEGPGPRSEPAARRGSSPTPATATLRAITVEGFRGIGRAVRLEFPPGPGLTLVVGRNGSGKSSFAEALELLL